MRLLILSPEQSHRYNRGHQLFRDYLAMFAETQYVGPGCEVDKTNIQDILNTLAVQPDAIITYGMKYTLPFTGLGFVDIPKVHFICDYLTPIPEIHPGYSSQYDRLLKRDDYNMLFVRNTRLWRHFTEKGWDRRHVQILPFGVDTNTFFPENKKTRDIDLSVCWSVVDRVYPNRFVLSEKAKQLASEYRVFTGRPTKQEYVGTLQRSKVNANSFSYWAGLNMRVFEAMACGAVCLTDYTEDLQTLGGFSEGHDYVSYSSSEEFREKFEFLMRNPKVCNRIAKSGLDTVQKFHSDEVRAEQAVTEIHKMLRG